MNEPLWMAWMQNERLDPELRNQLEILIASERQDELLDSFAKNLQFGTGGMREKMGPGTNRMNRYTVRRASYGVAQWIKKTHPEQKWSAAIGYDGRRNSKHFAKEAARVFAACGVHAHIFQTARPTPFLSYAVRELDCGGGVMVTASHNPPVYNGYKVYNSKGGQILEADAQQIVAEMEHISDLFAIPVMTLQEVEESPFIHDISPELEARYYLELSPLFEVEPKESKAALKIVYTPLHGTGAEPVATALALAGFSQVIPVQSQMSLDAAFTHVQSPNPEEQVAFTEALTVAQAVDADIILATDPDCDRVGMMVRGDEGSYTLLTGNEVGALLLHDLFSVHPAQVDQGIKQTAITTIVTSTFGEVVAASYGVATERVLTGFKYIGDKISQYEKTNEHTFVFGYEESVGYLLLPFVRDKDGVQGAVAIANMAAACKRIEGSVLLRLKNLYQQFGFFKDHLAGYQFSGLDGQMRMQALMSEFREQGLQVEGFQLEFLEDYLSLVCTEVATKQATSLDLPTSDVVKFRFVSGDWVAIRPSGTEPKLKVYIGVRAESEKEAEDKRQRLLYAVEERVSRYLQ